MIHQYDALVQKDSPFQTYVALQIGFVQPMPLATCALSSAIPSLSPAPERTIEHYYLRFTEIVSKLDKAPEELSDFGLDVEHAEKLEKYDDISTFKDVTLQLNRLTRSR